MQPPDSESGFTDVDRTADPAYYVRYLDAARTLEAAAAYKRRSFDLLALQPGARVLEVGCGVGDDVLALAGLVGADGQAVGVDYSETLIAAARERSAGSGLPVEFRVGDAEHLDLPDDSFDAARAERVFIHLADPARALAEMIRVTRRGGHVVLSEPDWETLIVDAPDRDVTRRLLHFGCDSLRQGWMGRRLYGLFHAAGLADVGVEPGTGVVTDYELASKVFEFPKLAAAGRDAGIVTVAEAEAWLGGLERAAAEGRFFCALTGFIAHGRKP